MSASVDKKRHSTTLKAVALLSVVRWYNIILMMLAQYLASIFIMRQPSDFWLTMADWRLHAIVLATGLVIASGFIINNFYDREKDLVNRPNQTLFERILTKRETLNLYLFFNFIASAIGLIISFRAFAFFAVYAGGLWLYSHKFKKITLLGNVTAAILSILPFFAVFFYYGLHRVDVVLYVCFLVFVEVIRNLTKDVEAIKGDVIYGYPTLPAVWGVSKTTQLIYGLIGLSFMPAAMFALSNSGWVRFVPLALACIMAAMALILRPSKKGSPVGYTRFNYAIKTVIALSILAIPLFGASRSFLG